MDNSQQIEVSIIVPAYNEERTISDCLASLLTQDYPANKYEIIAVKDGSTDNTESVELIENYPESLTKVKEAD